MKTISLKPILFVVAISLALSGCVGPTENHTEGLTITDGWVRVYEGTQAPGGMTGAFAVFENHTDKDISLIGGESEIAGMVEIHEVISVDGAMQMQAKDGGILIPAGEKVELAPGGLHVMFMNLTDKISEGDEITLTLKFEGHEDVSVTWPAKASMAGDEEYQSN
jgi:copper(I)-binding protein